MQWQPPPPQPSPETATSTEEEGRTDVVGDDDEEEEVGTSTSRNHRLTLQEILQNGLVFALEAIERWWFNYGYVTKIRPSEYIFVFKLLEEKYQNHDV